MFSLSTIAQGIKGTLAFCAGLITTGLFIGGAAISLKVALALLLAGSPYIRYAKFTFAFASSQLFFKPNLISFIERQTRLNLAAYAFYALLAASAYLITAIPAILASLTVTSLLPELFFFGLLTVAYKIARLIVPKFVELVAGFFSPSTSDTRLPGRLSSWDELETPGYKLGASALDTVLTQLFTQPITLLLNIVRGVRSQITTTKDEIMRFMVDAYHWILEIHPNFKAIPERFDVFGINAATSLTPPATPAVNTENRTPSLRRRSSTYPLYEPPTEHSREAHPIHDLHGSLPAAPPPKERLAV